MLIYFCCVCCSFLLHAYLFSLVVVITHINSLDMEQLEVAAASEKERFAGAVSRVRLSEKFDLFAESPQPMSSNLFGEDEIGLVTPNSGISASLFSSPPSLNVSPSTSVTSSCKSIDAISSSVLHSSDVLSSYGNEDSFDIDSVSESTWDVSELDALTLQRTFSPSLDDDMGSMQKTDRDVDRVTASSSFDSTRVSSISTDRHSLDDADHDSDGSLVEIDRSNHPLAL